MTAGGKNAKDAVTVAAVVPCYKVTQHVVGVVTELLEHVDHVVCVDDACPEGSGDLIAKSFKGERRVHLERHAKNQGVGGAMATGYAKALDIGADIAVKIDGDGQMSPSLIARFTGPIIEGRADYTKGNRFHNPSDVRGMPPVRLFGNAVLSFLTKLSTGYWNLFDPNNGFTAVHCAVLRLVPLELLHKRYFFETDMLFRLGLLRAKVHDVPMVSVYGDEVSNLKIGRELPSFLWGHLRNFTKRFLYNYLLRDFSIATLESIFGVLILAFGLVVGIDAWLDSATSGVPATAGQVMLAALPTLVGIQFILAALNYDIRLTPDRPIHPDLVLAERYGRAKKPMPAPEGADNEEK